MAVFGRNRPDGTRVTDMPRVRHFMPFLLPRRNDAVVYFEHRLDLSETLDYLERWNADPTRPPLTMFHLLIVALARTLHERPRVNRFVAGRRIYQRNAVEISCSVVKRKHDDARLSVTKQHYHPMQGITANRALIEEAVATGRGKEKTVSEREVAIVTHLPRSLLSLLMRGQRLLDHFNLVPAMMIRNDPLYASAMVSNLGSIGIDAAFHHLFEHGTVSVFMAIGKVSRVPVVLDDDRIVVRPVVTLRFAFDERIADGYYSARSFDLFQAMAEQPWRLEHPADNGPGAP